MLSLKKSFTLNKSELSNKFRVENNNLDISALIAATGYTIKKVGEIAKAHRRERNRKTTQETVFRYVQISDIDSRLGRIKSYRTFTGANAPNNARRIMRKGDVLVSTRRPTRGAVVSVPDEFDGHICTVFFTSLEIIEPELVDSGYLALFLRTSIGRMQFQAQITETAYPVISDDDVEGLTVLLPPLDSQRVLAETYQVAVGRYFEELNGAEKLIADAKRGVEVEILADFAEPIVPIVHGLTAEEDGEEEGDSEEDIGDAA